MKTAHDFFVATGGPPEQDDMRRVNCKQVGEPGHLFCGWCDIHDLPAFWCGCVSIIDESGDLQRWHYHK